MTDNASAENQVQSEEYGPFVTEDKRSQDAFTSSQPPPIDTDDHYDEELEIARAYYSSVNVGAVQTYQQPLSKQIQSDIAEQFYIDSEYFTFAVETQNRTIFRYALMRIITFAVFLIMTALQLVLYAGGITVLFGIQDFGASPLAPAILGLETGQTAQTGLILLLAIPVVGLIAALVRWGLRFLTFHILGVGAERLSFKVFTRFEAINSRVTDAAAKTRDRVGRVAWSERAKNWTIIALWNAKRAEYLDRFVTIGIWKVRTYIEQLERVFFALKIAAVVLASYVAFSIGMTVTLAVCHTILFLFLMAQTYFLWHRIGKKPDDFWTTQFRASANENDTIASAYVHKISGIVENLVDEVRKKEFGQGAAQDD